MSNSSRPAQSRHQFDVCVIGGGMSGVCAAIASARRGARTALVHDRPVLGGNASSEVRMWICGAHGEHNKEAGILEEIQLENLYRNPALNYSVWDSVLYGKVAFQPNLTPFLNCSVSGAKMEGDRIAEVTAWELTSQTWRTIEASLFIDCSGDSILAALTPAEFRIGREARDEFDEDIQPTVADQRTMGNSLLIQIRKCDTPQSYTPPRWAYKITDPADLPCRFEGVEAHNFWWIEVGGLKDTIGDAESIRDDLMKITYGVWDYLKNYAPERAKAANWAIEWIGSLPGKRENRRYVGDHILTQNDVRACGVFEDIVAYGGWSMDDHHPAGIYFPGSPTVFHPAPSPYGIPYRSLYSKNVPNLLFAGRNISVTHAALSSTRVMGTCSLIGQAAGTAAALCVLHGVEPRALSTGHRLEELQDALMEDDCWLPGLRRPQGELAASAEICSPEGDTALLLDGMERDRKDESHAWSGPLGAEVVYRWKQPVEIGAVRLVFDSNLNNEKRMPVVYPQRGDVNRVPGSLLRAFRIEAQDETGVWRTVRRVEENYQRLVVVPLGVRAVALRLIPEATWGGKEARIFAFEPLALYAPRIPDVPDGEAFTAARARVNPADLAPPEHGLDMTGRRVRAA